MSRCREHGFFQRQGRNTFVLAGSSSTLPSHTDQYPLPNGSLSIPSAPTYSSASSAATPPLISASLPPAAGNIVSTVDGYREPLTTVSVSDAEVKASKIEQLGQRPPMIWDPEYATMVKNTLRTTMVRFPLMAYAVADLYKGIAQPMLSYSIIYILTFSLSIVGPSSSLL